MNRARLNVVSLARLQARWDARLTREGMPPEIRLLTASSTRDGLRVVSIDLYGEGFAVQINFHTFGAPTSLSDLPESRQWADFGADVMALGRALGSAKRRFLRALADVGCVARASVAAGVPEKSGRRWFKRYLEEKTC
jgi:hypothetical protein